MSNTVYLLPVFHPGTRTTLSDDEMDAQIRERQEIMRKHKDHELMRAFQEMLNLQAARMTMEAMEPTVDNREHTAGQAFGVSYVASVLRSIIDYKQPEPEGEDD